MPAVVVLIPGDLETATGGYGYDRRIVSGLRALGWSVTVHALDGSFPEPTAAARRQAARILASQDAGAVVLIDGLAFGALGEEAEREATRLRLVSLVHHPLAAETGLSPATARALAASERHALRSARLVVVTSPATVAGVVAYGIEPERIVVVEPGTDRRHAVTRTPRAAGAPIELLCVAAIVPRKGYDVLMRALSMIRDLPWTATCVGSLARDVNTALSVQRLASELALAERVTFAGEARGDALDAFYQAADVFVLPTFHEGYGMVVAEALAAGLPVVATPTGAIPDLVGRNAGILVPIGDAGRLAEAIASVISDRDLFERLSTGAREAGARLPDWDASVRKMAAALTAVGRDG